MRCALRVALLLALAACTTPRPADEGPKDALAARGSSCSHEGKICGAEPTGFTHFLMCSRGKWTEMEAPPPPPSR